MGSHIAQALALCILEFLAHAVVRAGPSIDQDIIVISNSTVNAGDTGDGHPFVYGEWSFKDGILETANTPSAPDGGLRGVLYDRGLSCSVNVSDALPVPTNFHNLPKIALIKRGQCFFSQKLLYAQMDGAIGVIVFDNMSFSEDPVAQYGMTIAPDTVNISAYYVDQDIGEELYERLKNITQFNLDNMRDNANSSDGTNSQHLARLLYSHLLSYTVTYGGAGMRWKRKYRSIHLHQWILIIQQQQATDRTVGEELKFPVYHEPMGRNAISLTDLRESVVMESNESSEKSRARSIGNNSLYDYRDANKICSAEGNDGDKRVDCVICLDGFSRGDVLRRLPCGHEYHRDCIDPWLTKRSASCPLCKQELVSEIVSPAASYIEQRREGTSAHLHSSLDDVSALWERLSGNVSIAIRQNPGRHDDSLEMTSWSNDTAQY
ncbi:unnamed protein product [Umbelopsis vinacea]